MSQEGSQVEDKESQARAQLPYRAEYCKTSRAKCKKCSEPMEANSLKLANMTKSRFHDGFDASFYHVTCFFQIKRPTSVAEIGHYESLKYEDQKMLEKAVESKGLSVLGKSVEITEKKGKSSGKEGKVKKESNSRSKKRATDDDDGGVLVNYDDFLVEYAKSNRSKCVSCEQKIEKDTIRLGKLDYDADTPYNAGPVPRWHHVDCFVKSMEHLEFFGRIDKIKNFKELEKEDRDMLRGRVKPIKPKAGDENGKRVKIESAELASQEKEEERLLKKQSDFFFKLREQVDKIRRSDIEAMLEYMNQKHNFKAPASLIDHATDVLMFGPLKKCPQCKGRGGILLRGGSYICTLGSEEKPCTYETREPKRDVPDIPDELVEKYPFFEDKYKFHGGKRIFPTKFVKAVAQKEAEENKIVQEGAPLIGLSIGVISWQGVKMEKTKVQKRIITLGGKLQTTMDKSLFVILSSQDELDKESPKVEVAKALNVPLVKPEFLFSINDREDVVGQLEKCLLVKWDGDLGARYQEYSSAAAAIAASS